jgi:hypothetical protein
VSQGSSVEGWKKVVAYLNERVPVAISVHTAMRYSRRPVDPLPLKRWGPGRPRVYAIAAELDAWIARYHRTDAKEKP